MKIILREDIKNVGQKDDVVEVKNGYGRNYLIPTGKASLATESALKVLAENIKQAKFKQEKIKMQATEYAEKLTGMTLDILTKAGSNGKIFGSVTTIQIAQALKDKGFEVDRRKIVVDDIKFLGEYTATINLHREVSVEIKLNVVQE
ncbi:MAG: 50S ribosomal protein L9 [Flavobacteriales bacterium]|nr:50S ribosomal protein L9 [Flavobacteriales bacterium]